MNTGLDGVSRSTLKRRANANSLIRYASQRDHVESFCTCSAAFMLLLCYYFNWDRLGGLIAWEPQSVGCENSPFVVTSLLVPALYV